MSRYFARRCPVCKAQMGVLVGEPTPDKVQFIRALCALCGYRIQWTLIRSRKANFPNNSETKRTNRSSTVFMQ
jgi:C4-type Zn-finger protein